MDGQPPSPEMQRLDPKREGSPSLQLRAGHTDLRLDALETVPSPWCQGSGKSYKVQYITGFSIPNALYMPCKPFLENSLCNYWFGHFGSSAASGKRAVLGGPAAADAL